MVQEILLLLRTGYEGAYAADPGCSVLDYADYHGYIRSIAWRGRTAGLKCDGTTTGSR
jgi:hypothetical protein